MTPNEINELIRLALIGYTADLRASVESQARSHYDCSTIEDHIRSAAAEMLVEAIDLVHIPEVND